MIVYSNDLKGLTKEQLKLIIKIRNEEIIKLRHKIEELLEVIKSENAKRDYYDKYEEFR